jgi:hypothetical protein
MSQLGVCDWCARVVPLTQAGTTQRHDQVGVVVRARTGKRRRVCRGSHKWPRRTQP